MLLVIAHLDEVMMRDIGGSIIVLIGVNCIV